MKTKHIIILIVLALVAVYVGVVSYGTTPFEIFNLNSVFYFPSILMQVIANEGNGIICTDGCGACSAWGYNYLMVDGMCKIPDKVSDCYSISPPMDWEFVNGNCVPLAGVNNYNNTTPHDVDEFLDNRSRNMDFQIVLESGNIISGQYMISNGIVKQVSFVEEPRTLTIHIESSDDGELKVRVDYDLFYWSNVLAEQGYDVYADGKKITFNQYSLFILEIPFEKGVKKISIMKKEIEYNSIIPREHESGDLSVGDFKITESTPKWKIPKELSKMGCTDAMIIHLKQYSNAFAEKWDGDVGILDIGLPWGVHGYALDECMQNISKLRNNEK